MTKKTRKKELILVVDDQPNNLKVISSVLSDKYSLSFADSGKKALEILEKIKPKLILLDIMMPDMSGYEVCNEIMKNREAKDIPVIFLTAKSDIDDIIKGFDIGAVDYIIKPFNMKEIKVRIRNHITLANARDEIRQQKSKIEDFNQQLIQAHKKLKQSSEELRITNNKLVLSLKEKDKFFSIIAHDLKSPFIGLLGYLELLNEDFDSMEESDKKEMISSLLEISENMHALLENLLTWSRVQRDAIEFEPEIIKPREIVSDIITIFNSNLSMKKINCENLIEPEVSIFADKNMINTVFRNLISNAIKFTPESGRITIINGKCGDHDLLFSVKDSGVGIPDHIIPKLFQIDQHITSKGTNNEKGTGLGLILCKEFIEKHDGRIWVESVEGERTVFCFTIPE